MSTLATESVNLSIRRATEADIPVLRSLAERTWRVSYAEMLAPEQLDYMLACMYAPEQIAREMREGVIWELAVVNGRPVGFFSLTLEPGRRAKLNKLYVLPEEQGRGLGHALLLHIEKLAAAGGAREVWLRVNQRNERARRAYERSGYAVQRAEIFAIGGGYVMDDFIMSRVLPVSLEREPSRGSL
jgi:GNAT superfamily N-acetyltransferase